RPAQRAQLEVAAGPYRRYPLERVAEAHVKHATLAPNELQPIVLATELQGQAAAPVHEHCVVPLGAVTKAQATAATAGERPAVIAIPGRALGGGLLSLFAQQHRGASRGDIENHERRRTPRERGKLPLDEAGIDLVADDLRMRQQRLEESNVRGHTADL